MDDLAPVSALDDDATHAGTFLAAKSSLKWLHRASAILAAGLICGLLAAMF